MKIKTFTEQKNNTGIPIQRSLNTFDIYTEIKQKRLELDSLISVAAQYSEQCEQLTSNISNKGLELTELENQIDLTYEQLEFIIAEIKHIQKTNTQISVDIEEQKEKLKKLTEIVIDRTIETDSLQQIIIDIKNKNNEFIALQEKITNQQQLIINMDAELISKQALIETFDRNYSAKLHKKVIITKKTQFKQTG